MKRRERIEQCCNRARLFFPTNRTQALQLAMDQARRANDDPRWAAELDKSDPRYTPITLRSVQKGEESTIKTTKENDMKFMTCKELRERWVGYQNPYKLNELVRAKQ